MPTASHLPLIPVVDFIHAISDCFHFYGFHIQFSFPCTLLQPSVPSQLSRNPSSSALSLGWSCFCQISTSCCSLVWALHYLLEDSGSPSSLRMTFRSLAFWLWMKLLWQDAHIGTVPPNKPMDSSSFVVKVCSGSLSNKFHSFSLLPFCGRRLSRIRAFFLFSGGALSAWECLFLELALFSLPLGRNILEVTTGFRSISFQFHSLGKFSLVLCKW